MMSGKRIQKIARHKGILKYLLKELEISKVEDAEYDSDILDIYEVKI